jgi:hypothetical protein
MMMMMMWVGMGGCGCVYRERERERERERMRVCAVTFGKSTEDPMLLVGAENEFCFNLTFAALSSWGVCVKAHCSCRKTFYNIFREVNTKKLLEYLSKTNTSPEARAMLSCTLAQVVFGQMRVGPTHITTQLCTHARLENTWEGGR